jgi:hypothetical protein
MQSQENDGRVEKISRHIEKGSPLCMVQNYMTILKDQHIPE